jgi:hypothetical protein
VWIAVDALAVVVFGLSLRRAPTGRERRAAIAGAIVIAGLCQLTRLSAPGPLVSAVVVALLVALRVAAGRDERTRRRWSEDAGAAGARAELARARGEGIADLEVKAAWDVVCDALQEGWLEGAADVAALVAALERGEGRQLMEEASIGPDDDAPGSDRIALYHVGLVPSLRSCPRGPLVIELGRLADALDRATGSIAPA